MDDSRSPTMSRYFAKDEKELRSIVHRREPKYNEASIYQLVE